VLSRGLRMAQILIHVKHPVVHKRGEMWDWEVYNGPFNRTKIFGVCDWTGASAGNIQIDTPDED
jgi:hypothetical protein